MDKNNIISNLRYTFISILAGVSLSAIYQVIFVKNNDILESFLIGLSTILLILIPTMFRKNGIFVKKLQTYDERELVISIFANFLTMIVLFFAVVISFVKYINTGEVSIILISIKVLVIIGFKLFINYTLRHDS